jgi:hypothetical protein
MRVVSVFDLGRQFIYWILDQVQWETYLSVPSVFDLGLVHRGNRVRCWFSTVEWSRLGPWSRSNGCDESYSGKN